MRTTGFVDRVVRLGTCIAKTEFIVCEKIAAPVILVCDFCDRFVEAIYPRKKNIELNDGSTVPIVSRPLKRSPKSPPLSASQEYVKTEGRTSPKVRVSQNITLSPETQTWVSVKSERHGVMVLQPYDKLYEDKGIIITNGVVQVQPHETFRVLIANFTKKPQPLVKNQVVATLLLHPTEVIQSNVHLHEVLGLVDDSSDTLDANATNASTEVNLASHRYGTAEPGGEEKPPSVDAVDLFHLDSRYHARVRALLEKYSSMWDGKLGEIKLTEHRIDLMPDARPFAQPPYRAGPKARQIEQEHVDKMIREGVIEPAQSAWASPVVLVPKSDGSLRFCVDCRRLNAISIRNSYPLLRMDESIDSLGEASVFPTIDCNSGYWQISVRKQDRDKTAFVCHAGLYRYKRMPFILTNAPATFQRTLEILLSPYKWRSCLVYLEDIIIFSKSVEEHFQHVKDILTTFKGAVISLKLKKCSFFTNTVKYLGHIIHPGTLEVDATHTMALKRAKHPTTQTQLRAFLGLCNVYRRFVPKYSHIAGPLNVLLCKVQLVNLRPFGEDEAQAFETLVEAVTSPPVLALPKPDLPYSVDTDAPDYQVGCALFQTTEDGERRLIGYWSRSLKPAEKNYSTSEKECLAVVWAPTTLRPYLQCELFTV